MEYLAAMTEKRAWIPIATAWGLLAIVLAIQTYLAMIARGHSILRIIAYQLLVWSFWALLTPLLMTFTQRVPLFPVSGRGLLLHAAAMVALIAFWITITIVIRPYDAMTETRFGPYFSQAILVRFPFEIMIYLAVIAVAQMLELQSRASRLEESLASARLHALELQLQPHFLFNTLNAVSALVRGQKNSEAVEVIAGLSDLLRYTLDHAGDQRVPLEQEMSMLRRYLNIQRVRFPDRLEVQIDVHDNARRAAVPMLILQPLAENAIRHGVAKLAAAGRIEVRAYRESSSLHIEMFNTGTLTRGNSGIGLKNTEERLRQLYANRYQFELRDADGGGVLAEIAIPWSEVA